MDMTSRSEMMNYFLVIVSFTLLRVPVLCQALPDIHHQEEGGDESLLKFELMHVDHQDSPFYVRGRSVAEKFRASLTRSRNWRIKKSVTSKSKGVKVATTTTTFISPVTFGPAGIFLIPISIGTPAQKFTVILDTGSDITWIQCNPCTECYDQKDPLFEPTKSRTFKTFPCDSEVCAQLEFPLCANSTIPGDAPVCQYVVAYGDQSTTSGDFAGDVITLTSTIGRRKSLDFNFGCGRESEGTFQSTDGIVGFGRGQFSVPSRVGQNFGNIFSYCLDAAERSSPLLLGKGWARTNFSWSTLLRNEVFNSFYYMDVTGISVNGKLLDIPSTAFAIDGEGRGGMIIDSGTTVTMLVPAAFDPLLDALKALVPYPEVSPLGFGVDLCYSIANFTNPEFPGAVFHFGEGAELHLPARNLWLLTDDIGTMCFAVLSSSFGFSIMGNIQQQNVHIAYDLGNSLIGFQSEVDCSTL